MKNSALFFLLLLAACGFSPVYGSHEDKDPVAEQMNEIAIDNIPNREGQMMRNDLIDRMYGKGRPEAPKYTLHVVINISIQDLGIQADATSTRSLMDLIANYSLKNESGKEVLTGSAHSITSFNKLLNQYGTLAADVSARERTIHEASEQIVNRLNMFFAEGPQQAPGETPQSIPEPALPPAPSMINPYSAF